MLCYGVPRFPGSGERSGCRPGSDAGVREAVAAGPGGLLHHGCGQGGSAGDSLQRERFVVPSCIQYYSVRKCTNRFDNDVMVPCGIFYTYLVMYCSIVVLPYVSLVFGFFALLLKVWLILNIMSVKVVLDAGVLPLSAVMFDWGWLRGLSVSCRVVSCFVLFCLVLSCLVTLPYPCLLYTSPSPRD